MTALRQGHNAVAYRSRGCRCRTCRSAQTEEQRQGNASRAERLRADPTLAEHGRNSTYNNWGCRCEPCTAAHSVKCHQEYLTRRGAR